MIKFLKFKVLTALLVLFTININAQEANLSDFSITVGTDIPYEHYVGLNYNINKFDLSYRTGVLAPPYSDLLINSLSIYDVKDEYIDLLEATFEFGWMNSLGAYYRFGEQNQWYIGTEFRIDYFNQKTTPVEVFETIFEDSSVSNLNIIDENIRDTEIGLTTFAFGLRIGRTFQLIKDNPQHLLNVEFALHRYISSRSKVTLNGNESGAVGRLTDELLWNNFFRDHGQVPVLGVSYTYVFKKKK